MKKLIACILVIVMAATLAACGNKENTPSNGNNETTKAAEATKPVETTTPEPTATTAPTTTTAPTETPEPTPDTITDVNVTTPAPETTPEPVVAEDDLGELVGAWYELADLFPRTLNVSADGSFELRYQGSGAIYGSVVAQSENGVAPFYIFSESDGTFFASAQKDFTDGIIVLQTVAEGELRFARDTGSPEDEFPESVPGDEYCGTYQSDRAVMTVMREGAGAFIFDIVWATSANEWVEWNYWTFYSDEDGAFHGDGGSVKWNCRYDDVSGEEVKDVVWTDGKADFAPSENGSMFWIDQTGEIEGEMQFRKM